MTYTSSHLLFLYPFLFQDLAAAPLKEMGLPRINMAAADRFWPCPRAKWHLLGFDASIQYGERSRRFGASLGEGVEPLDPPPCLLRGEGSSTALAHFRWPAPPSPYAPCDLQPRDSKFNHPILKDGYIHSCSTTSKGATTVQA